MDKTSENGLRDAGTAHAADGPTPLDLNARDYTRDLDGLDLTEAQKNALLETLWSIMAQMANLAITVDVCGYVFEDIENAPALAPNDVDLGIPSTTESPSTEDGKAGGA